MTLWMLEKVAVNVGPELGAVGDDPLLPPQAATSAAAPIPHARTTGRSRTAARGWIGFTRPPVGTRAGILRTAAVSIVSACTSKYILRFLPA